MANLSLFSAETSNTTSNVVKIISLRSDVPNSGFVIIHVRGTFTNGVVKPQGSLDNANFDNIQREKDDGTFADVRLTAPGFFGLQLREGMWIRLEITSGTSESITADILGDVEAA